MTDEVNKLAALLEHWLAGNDQTEASLVSDVEVILERGLLPQFGRAALELMLRHQLARLGSRRTILAAKAVKPRLH
jgi:hypothetical protein